MKDLSKAVEFLFSKLKGKRAARDYLRLKRVDRDLTNVKSGDLILDVGCGLALDDFLYASKGVMCNCLDLHQESLKMAKSWARYLKTENKMNFILGDALHLPFKDACFDAVVSYSAIEHLRCGYDKWIYEMARVAREGGLVVLTTSNRSWFFYPIARLYSKIRIIDFEYFFHYDEITDLLERNGLKIIAWDAEGLYVYHIFPESLYIGRILNDLLHKLEEICLRKFPCLRKICGRFGFSCIKKSNGRKMNE